MTDNAFDQFDAPAAAPASNAFDQFDKSAPTLKRSGVSDFVDKQLPTDANAPSYASGAGYLIDNPLTRSFGGVANRIAQGAAHIVGATDAERALQQRASAFNSPSDANTIEKVAHTVGGVVGAAPAFVLGGAPGAAALAATNTGADLSDRDAAGEDTSALQKAGIGAANLITNFLPVHLGGGLTRRIVTGATIGAGGAALNNAAQGNDITNGIATGALIGGAFGGLHRQGVPAEAPPAPQPEPKALTHEPDFVTDAQGRTLNNKGDHTLGQPATGGPGMDQPRYPTAAPGSLADAANALDTNAHLQLGHEPDFITDERGRIVPNKIDKTAREPFGGTGLTEETPKGATENGRGNAPDAGAEPPAESDATAAQGPAGKDNDGGAAASVDPDAAHRAAFETRLDAVAQAHGFGQDQADNLRQQFYQPLPRDRVSGFYRSEELDPAVARAQDFARTTGKPAVYLEADATNQNGLNAKLGTSGADVHLNEVSNAMLEHLKDAAGDDVHVVPVRKGGDEYGFVVTGATPEQVHEAARNARTDISDYVDRQGLSHIPRKGGNAPVGFGLHFGLSEIPPNGDLKAVFQHADQQVEARKVGATDYEFTKPAGETGTQSSGERPESAGGGTDATARSGPTERTVGDQSAVPKPADEQPAGGDNASRPDVAGANRASDAITEQSAGAKPGSGADGGKPATVKTSVGDVSVDRSHDIPLLGSSSKDGTVHIDKDWQPVIKDGPLKGLDRTPFLVEHEAVEAHAEQRGQNYSQSHFDHAEPAEHKMLLDHLGLKDGTPEADKAIEAYEQSYKQDLKDAAAKKNPNVPPDLITKPYDHPHTQEQRRMQADVDSEQNGTGEGAHAAGERGGGHAAPDDRTAGLEGEQQQAVRERTAAQGKTSDVGDSRTARVAQSAEDHFQNLPKEIGWDQIGGRILREADRADGQKSEVTGRTQWVGKPGYLGESELWRGRPDKINEAQAREAFRKANAGENLSPREQRFIDYAKHTAKVYAEHEEAMRGEDATRRGFESVDAMHERDALNVVHDHDYSDVPFSRGESRRGMPKASVADALKEPLANLKGDAPKVFIHQTHDEAPPNLRRSKGFDRSVKGAYDPNTNSVHVFADSIHTPREAQEVLTHEVIGHYGLEKVVGKEWGKLVADINAMRERSPAAMRDIFKEVEHRYPGATPDTFASEAMAVMSEHGIKNSIMDRVLSAVRRFIRSLGFNTKFSDAELRQMLVAAKRRVESGRSVSAAQGNGLSFSKRAGGASDDMFGGAEKPKDEGAAAPRPATGDLFGGASTRDHVDAAVRAKDDKLSGKGSAPTMRQGDGELFAGGRPAQVTIPEGIEARIAEAEKNGVALSSADKKAIREANERAETNARAASRKSVADPFNKGNAFPMGVGFTRETKRSNQRIDSSVRKAGEAVKHFGIAKSAQETVENLLRGKGTDADKAVKAQRRETSHETLMRKLLAGSLDDKVMGFKVEKVNRDKDGYPSSLTFSGDGIIKGVNDKIDLARSIFGSKDSIRSIVDKIKSEEKSAIGGTDMRETVDSGVKFSKSAETDIGNKDEPQSFLDKATGLLRPNKAELASRAIKQVALQGRDLARGVARAAWAARDRAVGTADSAIDAFRSHFDARPKDIRSDPSKAYADVIAYQQKKPIADPVAAKFIDTMADMLDKQASAIRAFGEDKLGLLDQYFPQLWKDPGRAEKMYADMQAKRPLAGSKGFTKERVFEDYEAGIKAGMEPAFDNPADALMARYQSGERYLSALKIKDGIDTLGMLQDIGQGDRVPVGFARVNDNTFAGKVVPEMVARDLNNYLAPGLSQFKAWRNFRWLQNVLLSARLGFSAFHAGFTTVDSAMTHLDLGFRKALSGDIAGALKHMGQIPLTPIHAVQGLFGKGEGAKLVRQFYGKDAINDPHTAAVLDALTQGGARGRMDPTDFNNDFAQTLRAWKTDGIPGLTKTPLKTLGAVLEGAMRPIAHNLVPAQKMTARVELMKHELDRVAQQLGAKKGDYAAITKAMNPDALKQIAHSVVQRVDDRLGQLAYDNLFWNRSVKDLMQASIQSVGWNVGTKNVIFGGLADARKIFKPESLLAPLDKEGKITDATMSRITGRLSYLIALNVGVGTLGAMTQYMLTGQGPQELKDYFFPKTGNKNPDGTDARISFPSYVKDEFGFARHPIDTVEHKLHPSFSMIAELLNNKDFYGNQIINPDDPWTKVAGQVAGYVGKGFVPYAVQNQNNIAQAGGGIGARLAPFVGVTPAPGSESHSDTQNYISQSYYAAHPSEGKTPESAAHSKDFSAAITTLRNGGQPDLSQFTAAERAKISKYAREDPAKLVEKHFAALPLQQQLVAYGKASDAERKQYNMRATMFRGSAKGLAKESDPETRERLRAKLESLRGQ